MGQVLVEVVERNPASGDLRKRAPTVPEDFDQRSDEVMDATLDIADRLRAKLEEKADTLTETAAGWGLRQVDLQFGLALQAETGVIVAKVGGTASFQVTLTWKKGDG